MKSFTRVSAESREREQFVRGLLREDTSFLHTLLETGDPRLTSPVFDGDTPLHKVPKAGSEAAQFEVLRYPWALAALDASGRHPVAFEYSIFAYEAVRLAMMDIPGVMELNGGIVAHAMALNPTRAILKKFTDGKHDGLLGIRFPGLSPSKRSPPEGFTVKEQLERSKAAGLVRAGSHKHRNGGNWSVDLRSTQFGSGNAGSWSAYGPLDDDGY